MVMVMIHDRCFAFDGSDASLRFDEELDLRLGVFGYVGVCV
jgi:hypothetical protein